jgi:hypothetical protein
MSLTEAQLYNLASGGGSVYGTHNMKLFWVAKQLKSGDFVYVAGPFATFAAAASRASPKRVIVSSEVSVRLEKGVEKQ